LTVKPLFKVVIALALLCGAGSASAGETTGLITAYDEASRRITLGNGKIFSMPESVRPDAIRVGMVVRITFEEYGENDDEVRVTNIVRVSMDSLGPAS